MFIKSISIELISSDEAKNLLGGRLPNMFNVSDWPAIFALYNATRNTNGIGTPPYNQFWQWKQFRVLANGDIQGTPVGGPTTIPANFTPNDYPLLGCDLSTIPTTNTDGSFYVPFWAFVRFVQGYNALPLAQRPGYLNMGSANLANLALSPSTCSAARNVLNSNNLVANYFTPRRPVPRPTGPTRGEILTDWGFGDPFYYDYVAEIDFDPEDFFPWDDIDPDEDVSTDAPHDGETQNEPEPEEPEKDDQNGDFESYTYQQGEVGANGGEGYWVHQWIDNGGNPHIEIVDEKDVPDKWKDDAPSH